MPLTQQQRDEVSAALMDYWSRRWADTPYLASIVSQAVADTDDWVDANQTSYNNALNATFRSNATTIQKTILFCFVAAERAVTGAARRLINQI